MKGVYLLEATTTELQSLDILTNVIYCIYQNTCCRNPARSRYPRG
jgi:hypothetical protein